MTELELARKTITETDKKIARLFETRMDAVRAVAEYKKKNGLPVFDDAREKELIKTCSEKIVNEEYKSYYTTFQRNMMSVSKAYQHKLLCGMRVAYGGVPGAFANIAAEKIFPDAECIGCADFKSAYEAVESGKCDCAVLPLENSKNGDVGEVWDLAFFGTLSITGVYETEIVQNLLGVPGAVLADVKTVMSHPQALGQCAEYIRKMGFEAVETVNTAAAAKAVAELSQKEIAAIASEEAAEKFGLVKLDSHINGKNVNTTRFAVFSRASEAAKSGDERFVMAFTVKNEAGALGRAVSSIGKRGFNLRALKSRPTKELTWNYYFYAEGEGSIESENGKKMISELSKDCLDVKILGSFKKEIKI